MATPTPPGAPRPPAGPGRLSQRTDIGQGSSGQQGIYTPTGQPYGQATAERTALKAAPIPRADMFAPGGGPSTGSPAAAPAPGMANNLAPPAGPQQPPPGIPDIHSLMNVPTRNPNEPVTAGLPIGPGPGPTPQPSPAAQVLSYLAGTGFATDQVKDLANRLSKGNVQY